LNYLFLFWYVGYLKASVTCFSTFVTTMALAWAFAKLDYQSSIMANEGTQTRSRQLEEQVRAMRESMDKIQADLAERMQQQSEEFQAQKQLQQQQFEKQVVESIFEIQREVSGFNLSQRGIEATPFDALQFRLTLQGQ
jgi:TolA-binding protein